MFSFQAAVCFPGMVAAMLFISLTPFSLSSLAPTLCAASSLKERAPAPNEACRNPQGFPTLCVAPHQNSPQRRFRVNWFSRAFRQEDFNAGAGMRFSSLLLSRKGGAGLMDGTVLPSPYGRVASDTGRQIEQRYYSSLTGLLSVLLQAVVGILI